MPIEVLASYINVEFMQMFELTTFVLLPISLIRLVFA